jgi:outer membrane lipoprotein-sorting protein
VRGITVRKTAIVLAVCLAASAATARAREIDQATRKRIEQRISRLSGSSWNTLSAETTFSSQWKKGAQNTPEETGLPFLPSISEVKFKTYLKKPNKVRIEITHCSIPLLDGMILIQSGKDIYAYDSISERTITSDLSLLFGSNPEGIGSTFRWLDFFSGLGAYDIEYHEIEKLSGKDVYHVTLRFKKPFELFGLFVDRDEIYIDPKRITMVKEVVYAADGKMLVTLRAVKEKEVEPGLWIPAEIHTLNRFGARAVLTVEWVSGKLLMPTRIEGTAPGGVAKALIVHKNINVDKPIPDSMFKIER